MTTKKKAETAGSEEATQDSTLDRLVTLRKSISGESATTELLDILIDERKGDTD